VIDDAALDPEKVSNRGSAIKQIRRSSGGVSHC